MNKSAYLLRANPALTTNVKLIVSENYFLYLESYDSNRELSDKKYKKYGVDEGVFLSESLSKFYKNLPVELAYEIKNEVASDNIQDNFANQYDSIYWSGARYIEDNRHEEEFQYNTTLKIVTNSLPKEFMIFRKDKTGADNDYSNDLNYFKELKLIKTFDLTNKTSIGRLFEKNYVTDDRLPRSPLELNFKEYEFSKWKGYNYHSGGNGHVSFFLQEYFQNENTYYNVEKFLTKGFKDNGIIASNYLNLSYLFNDTVADVFVQGEKYYLSDNYDIIKLIQNKHITEEQYRISTDSTHNVFYVFNKDIPYRKSWTINRYTGFYINNKICLDKLSTYNGIKFKENTTIEIVDNIFMDGFNYANPIDGKYKFNIPIFLKNNNEFLLIEKNKHDQFVIVSDEIINDTLDNILTNQQESIKIEYSENPNIPNEYHNYIKNNNGSPYYNSKFKTYDNGILVIEIFDELYTLYVDNTLELVYINTDEYITADEDILYRKLGNKKDRINNLFINNKDNNIIYFNVYLLEFTDIKDFDFNRTDTTYTRKEYERNNELDYFRPGIYARDIKSTYIPSDLFYETDYNIWIKDYDSNLTQLNNTNKYILSVASEYSASSDLYMFNLLDDMTDIWDINQHVIKWGLNESINNNSYRYKINNNLTYSGINNFTSFVSGKRIDINKLNLDYFFSIGQPINHDQANPETLTTFFHQQNNIDNRFDNIVFRTLNVDMPLILDDPVYFGSIYTLLSFDINFYKNLGTITDYFNLILNQKVILNRTDPIDSKTQRYDRISYLQKPDEVNGPEVYFKGFNAYVNYLQHKDMNEIGECKKIPASDLEGYDFSILFSSRKMLEEKDLDRIGNGGIECIINKKFKNILINIYLCVPEGSFTNVEYSLRNNIYNCDYVEYIENDVWKISTLETKSLTLDNFISELNSKTLKSDAYLDGIHYTILEEVERYTVENFDLYDNTNLSLVKIKLNNPINLKHGDWIKIYNTGLLDYDNNLKVIEILNNKIIVCKVDNDQDLNVDTLNLNLSHIYLTMGVSDKPFEFQIKNPDVISIDTNKYNVVDVDVCPINAINNSNINSDIIIDIENDGLIENVYNDLGVNTKNIKKEYLELNDKNYNNLPYIYRYSGDYEPILKDINIFNNNKIKLVNNSFDLNLGLFVRYFSKQKIGDYYYVSIHIKTTTIITNNLEIGDMINFLFPLNVPELVFLNGTTNNIKDIKPSYIDQTLSEIVLSTRYDDLIFPDIEIPLINGEITLTPVIMFKNIKSNLLFDNSYNDFGINNDIMIAKVFTTKNPMRTIKSVNNTDSKYAMIDEHGTTTVNKNIFKSPWDLKYYYETLPNKYKTIT